MKKNWERRDILLLLTLAALVIDIIIRLPVKELNAETFKLDNCITLQPGEKPAAYLHVVTH